MSTTSRASFNERKVAVETSDGRELRFDVWGEPGAETNTVIALHGFPQGARSYAEVAELLATDGLTLVAPDQRGYSPGARPEDMAAYRDDILASDVIALADALGLSSFHLVGHDWGSHIAWVTAATYPDRIRSLTAVSVPHPAAYAEAFRVDPEQTKKSAYIKLFWQPGVAEEELLADNASALRGMLQDVDPAQIDYYVDRLSAPGALTAALNYYRAMHSDSANTPHVTVPTTLVWSDRDLALGRTGTDLCEKYVDADYKLVTIEGVTHWIPERAPRELADAIKDRVHSVDPS